jgi:hypothetical protein
MDKYYYYDIDVQIWEDEDGSVVYSVIQSFSDQEDDIEVIAYGSVDTKAEAIKRAREAVLTVLE